MVIAEILVGSSKNAEQDKFSVIFDNTCSYGNLQNQIQHLICNFPTTLPLTRGMFGTAIWCRLEGLSIFQTCLIETELKVLFIFSI